MTNLITGLICLALGAWGLVAWWDEFGQVLRGCVPLLLVLLGLAAVGAGMNQKTACKPDRNRENPNEPRADAAGALGRRD